MAAVNIDRAGGGEGRGGLRSRRDVKVSGVNKLGLLFRVHNFNNLEVLAIIFRKDTLSHISFTPKITRKPMLHCSRLHASDLIGSLQSGND